ncbi:MAG TPA: hypothetical protein VGL91_02570 [Acidobacteriota bacterium]|jgi:hypothetical protein
MDTKLTLVPIIETQKTIPPAALYERDAAFYLKLSIHAFRSLVRAGTIPFRNHIGRKRRIYLRDDLDLYLSRLPRHFGKATIAAIEDSPRADERRNE